MPYDCECVSPAILSYFTALALWDVPAAGYKDNLKKVDAMKDFTNNLSLDIGEADKKRPELSKYHNWLKYFQGICGHLNKTTKTFIHSILLEACHCEMFCFLIYS